MVLKRKQTSFEWCGQRTFKKPHPFADGPVKPALTLAGKRILRRERKEKA
jgi:hypothetical protein